MQFIISVDWIASVKLGKTSQHKHVASTMIEALKEETKRKNPCVLPSPRTSTPHNESRSMVADIEASASPSLYNNVISKDVRCLDTTLVTQEEQARHTVRQ